MPESWKRVPALLVSTYLLCMIASVSLAQTETAPLRGPEEIACDGPVAGTSTIWDAGGGVVDVTVTFTTAPSYTRFDVYWTCTSVPGGCHEDECGSARIGSVWTDADGAGTMTLSVVNPFPGQPVHLQLVERFPEGLTRSPGGVSAFGEVQGGVGPRRYTSTFDGTPSDNVNHAPDWNDWHPGDVHVHAAGDTHLGIHPQCDGDLFTQTLCAFRLVDNVLQRARRFGAEWLIFTEHIPWLGFQRDNDVFLYDSAQGAAQWGEIKDWLDTLSGGEIRGLMGAELGTAIPACTSVDVSLEMDFVCEAFPPFCGWVPRVSSPKLSSPGHYGVYTTPSYIDDSMVDCNETGENGYVDDVLEAGGWGGINHPDNADGGSPWWCYSSESVDGELQGREEQPQLGFRQLERCPVGIDRYGVSAPAETGAFRSIELISGHNLPSAKTLGIWDMFLQNDFRVSAVGGGDGHTAPRKQDVAGLAKCLAKFHPLYPGDEPSIGECVDAGSAPGDPNHNKVAGSGRTLAFYPDGPVASGAYDSSDPDDPARRAIREGRTVATNGPEATAQIKGGFPGATVTVADGEPLELRIDWRGSWSAVGDTLGGSRDFSKIEEDEFDSIPEFPDELHRFSSEVPDRIVVVTGLTDGCGSNRFHCAAAVERKVIDIVDGETDADGVTLFASDGIADVTLDQLGGRGYVRVELYWDVDEDGEEALDDHHDTDDDDRPRYYDDRAFDFGAFTSPIYVSRSETIEILGTVVDANTGDPVEGAWVEVCRTDSPWTCVTTTSAAGGAFGAIAGAAGNWRARAFPPAGATTLGAANLSLGLVPPGTSRTITLGLPQGPVFIDPAGTVLDIAGNPIEGAEVRLWHAEAMEGPYVELPDGDGRMSPANRTNPVVTSAEGTFAWDVLAGWYKVTASKAGCRTPAGADFADSGALQVPPPVLDLKLVLDCRPDDTTPPVITITGGPAAPTTETAVSYGVSIADEDPGAAAFCLLDDEVATDEEGGLPDALPVCTDPFLIGDLADGPHRLSVIALDTRANLATDERSFVVLGQGLQGDKLVLKTSPTVPGRAVVVGRVSDPVLGLRRGNGSADDPTLHGGSLRLRGTGAAPYEKAFELAASSWKRIGKTPNRGYLYKAARGGPGLVRSVAVRPGPKGAKLTFRAKGDIPFNLAGEPEGVRVEVRLGARLYCLEFGEDATFRPGKSWIAKESAAPECP